MAVGQRWMIEREAEVILSLPTRNVLWTQFSAAYRKRRDRFYDRKATPRAFLDEASDGPYLSPLFPTHQTQDKRSRMGGVAMRKTLEGGIPDTAPYKEWLGLVATMAVAVLICAVLFAAGVPV